ncbi:MAG: hypothetical protein IT370_09890 [Deltaproteobacteria bacterium]|nr:hypothetical protein [Deltaproteobacteria bacterium]
MKLAFLVADAAQQSARFATVRLLHAALRRGHDVVLVSIGDLTLQPGGSIVADAVRPVPAADEDALAESLRTAPREGIDLATMDAVFLRYHPAREGPAVEQRTSPGLDFGVRLEAAGVLVVNSPEGAHAAGGRMYVSTLPADVRPRSLITRSPDKIKQFLRELDAPAVIKPLTDVRGQHDGEQVFYVGRGQLKNLNQIIAVVRQSGFVLAQEYLPDAENGELRLLLLDGEPLVVEGRTALYRRTHPGLADAPAHLKRRIGKRSRPAEFDAGVQKIVASIGARLRDDGLFFVACDVVGGKVLGVNVHTPGGLHTATDLYSVDFAGAVIDRLERRAADHRRSA